MRAGRLALCLGALLILAASRAADAQNVTIAPIITTVAGNGAGAGTQSGGYSGDNGPATSAEMSVPWGVATDSAGNLYIADSANNRVRVVNMQASTITIAGITIPAGYINTVAGNGVGAGTKCGAFNYYSGDGGPATSAELDCPYAVAVDSAGNIYIADQLNNVIRRVNTLGIITTVAGNGSAGYKLDNVPATTAQLWSPSGVAVDSAGNLYIGDTVNNRVRCVNMQSFPITIAGITIPAGYINTVAGNGSAGYKLDNVLATRAQLNQPEGVAVDSAGNFYIGDFGNNRVRKVNTLGIITTVAGNGTGGYNGDNIAATSAELWTPLGVAVDGAGDIYIGDQSNQRIRKVDTSGNITTVAGNGTYGYSGDGGPATSAELDNPTGVALDSASNFYIVDHGNMVIREVNVTTLALSFGSLNVGQTSSTQSLTVSDVGNAALNFSSLLTSSNFILQSVNNECLAGTPLGVGSSCALGVAFAPTIAGNLLTGALTFNDDAFNTPQFVNLTGTANQVTPTVSFTGAPASAPYHATFTVTATTDASTTAVLTASGVCSIVGTTVTVTKSSGTCSLTANWAADNEYFAATATQSTIATMATPTISWATPAAITFGTALTAKQLDATATNAGSSVGGTFAYMPAKGAVLGAGSQMLSVTFTPNNTTNYTAASGTIMLQVNQATPKITWAKPAAITYGTALSSTQLDATTTVAGGFVYSPAAGTVLAAGAQTLAVTFTPTDTTDYTTATSTVTLTVSKVSSTTTITANTPNPSVVNQAVTVSFAVSGGGVGPTGSVTVAAGTGESCTGALTAGAGSCSLNFASAGSRMLTAKYPGDTNFKSSASAKVAQTVTQ